jgi:hypothetical protein
MTILQEAEIVDDSWVLTRKDCDSLCHNYQRMVELTLKALLEGWRRDNPKVKHFLTATNPVTKEDQKYKYYKRYENTRDLVALADVAAAHVPGFGGAMPPRDALHVITTCAQDTTYGTAYTTHPRRISCHDFFVTAQRVDPFLLACWNFMSTVNTRHATGHLGADGAPFAEWVTEKKKNCGSV